jgi:hypothetical protein
MNLTDQTDMKRSDGNHHDIWARNVGKINIHKSKASPIEPWDNAEKTVHTKHTIEEIIFRIRFPGTIRLITHHICTTSPKNFKILARKKNYLIDQCERQATRFVHISLQSTLSYRTQFLPVTPGHTSNRYCIVWYVRKGEVFRAPIYTLQRLASRGGTGLVDVYSHCMTEICALLGLYAAYIGNQLPNFWEKLTGPWSASSSLCNILIDP